MPRRPAIENVTPAKSKKMRDKIVAVMDARNLSQKEVAAMADVDPSTLNRILSPRVLQIPSENTVRKIADTIGIKFEMLVDGQYGIDDVTEYVKLGPPHEVKPVETANGEHQNGVAAHAEPEERQLPNYLAAVIHSLGTEEALRRLMNNSEVAEERAAKPVPQYFAAMIEAIGPLKALRRLLVDPNTGEVSL